MREIEFRGIDEKGDWQYGTYYYGVMYPTSFNGHYINDTQVNEDTVGQYTGLKKGERKIYNGDILFDEIEGDNGDERHYFVVRWLKEKCSFVFMDYGDTVKDWERFEEDLWHDWPVQVDQVNLDAMHYAGNIHENYELLLQ